MQDDNRALDRLTKSKEAALLEAERTVQIALAKASLVDDLQNKNQELMKQIEICQVFLSFDNSLFQNIHVNEGIHLQLDLTCLAHISGGEQNPRQNASAEGCGG